MVRLALVLLALAALIWMLVPLIGSEETEMGFVAGGPDPNVYKTTCFFGWPLTWITWERSWNEAAGYDDSKFAPFSPLNFVIHLLAIAVPLLLFVRLRRTRGGTLSAATAESMDTQSDMANS